MGNELSTSKQLTDAASHDDIDVVKRLLSHQHLDLNSQDKVIGMVDSGEQLL